MISHLTAGAEQGPLFEPLEALLQVLPAVDFYAQTPRAGV